MSKRSRRLGKKNELRAVVEAIGSSLGKTSDEMAADLRDQGGKPPRNRSASKAAAKRWTATKE